MKLAARHQFAASVNAVCDAMGDPDFYASLRLPDVDPPELISRTGDDDHVAVSVRFRYTGKLDAIARRIVRSDHISWIQELAIDRTSRSCALKVVPETGTIPVACTGRFVLHEEGAGCLRVLDGDLRIRVPLIGSRAERSLAPGIMSRLDHEAEALDAYLAT